MAKLLVLVACLLGSCAANLDNEVAAMVSSQFSVVYARGVDKYGVTRPPPVLIFTTDLGRELAGWADCRDWTIKISVYGLRDYPHYVMTSTLPHEYAHLVHCALYGGLGYPVHNNDWANIMIGLGGDPNWTEITYYE